MPLQKQAIDISFAKGLDTKTDPKRIGIGNFSMLRNSVFTKGGLLTKRNGYAALAALPNDSYAYLSTLRDNLTALGPTIAAYNQSNSTWVSRGTLAPMVVDTLPLIRNNFNQTQSDTAIAPNGLVCMVYTETNGSATTIKYAIADSVTGQNIVAPAAIPVVSGTVTGSARVFVLGNNFILVFTNVITAVSHLQYIAISVNDPATFGTNTDIASSYTPATTVAWDGYVADNALYLAYNTVTGGQSIKVVKLTSTLTLTTATTFAGQIATMVSVTADMTGPSPIIWVSYYDFAGKTGYTLAVNTSLNVVLTATQVIASGDYLNIASAAQDGVNKVFAEADNNYGFSTGIPTHYVQAKTVTQAGTVSAALTIIRSVGLASKAFIVDGTIYFLGAFQSPYQPSYFLINGSSSLAASPIVVAKLAYQNGGGYLTKGLPSVTVIDSTVAYVPYLFKDLIQSVNKGTDIPTGTQTAGIYSQTGINLATFDITTDGIDSAEIAGDLHISGGFLWMYDGYLPVEHNFFLWPDTDLDAPSDSAVWSATGGLMVAKPDGSTNDNAYFYQFTYEWTDNAGNAFRSAPSIPIPVTTSGALSTGSVVLNIPTLRLTYKVPNPVKIVIYRWSVAQQAYYAVTSITTPLLNSTTVDYVTFTDTLADASILGNALIYTTGGVVEDVNAPASNLMTLFDNRLFLVDAEDQNLLWFSKQVIEGTPVEMSNLFTMFVSPTTAAQGPTGPMTAIAVMDDKLVIFKKNAIYYINGAGPDNTGANNQFSQPIFITATIGCTNQQSIVFMPQGLMFQSDKGIWLLGRDLSTSYIGAPVEEFNAGIVENAQNIPATNQVRFILSTGITLMFDYFYGQWGTFVGVPAISSCIYNGLHTFINSYGAAYQESPGTYLDGSAPVLLAFQTGPLRLGDLQNYQRAYFFYLLGEYFSPHKLAVNIFYDYATTPADSTIITPTNYSTPYGSGLSQSPYGAGDPYGGGSHLEDWRVFLSRQRCMAFAIEIQEIYDATLDVPAGQGLTLSGLNVICGFKSKYRPQAAAQTVGAG